MFFENPKTTNPTRMFHHGRFNYLSCMFFINFQIFLFKCVCIYMPECTYVHRVCRSSEEGIGSPGTRAPGSCEPSHDYPGSKNSKGSEMWSQLSSSLALKSTDNDEEFQATEEKEMKGLIMSYIIMLTLFLKA